MKNEFGDIIKKKVEKASSSNPPTMNWERLDSSSRQLEQVVKAKGLSFTAKIVLISALTIVTIASVAILFQKHSSKTIQEPQLPLKKQEVKSREKTKRENVLGSEETTNATSTETIINKNTEQRIKKEQKKDIFEPESNTKSVSKLPNAKRQSKTTTIYEVDTVTTETYIYE